MASQTLIAYVSDRDAYACTLRARQSGSRPLARRPVDYSETPACPSLYLTGPIRRHARVIRNRHQDLLGDLFEPRTSNLDVLSCLGPTPAPAPRRPTYGFCAHSWALIRGLLSHVQLRCMCMCWRGTLVKLLTPPECSHHICVCVYIMLICCLRAQLGARSAALSSELFECVRPSPG